MTFFTKMMVKEAHCSRQDEAPPMRMQSRRPSRLLFMPFRSFTRFSSCKSFLPSRGLFRCTHRAAGYFSWLIMAGSCCLLLWVRLWDTWSLVTLQWPRALLVIKAWDLRERHTFLHGSPIATEVGSIRCSNVQKRLIFKTEYGSTFPIFLHVV